MQLVKAYDYNDASDVYVTGVAHMDQTAPGVVRVAFFTEKIDTHDEGRERKSWTARPGPWLTW
jgi:hypothetical protein